MILHKVARIGRSALLVLEAALLLTLVRLAVVLLPFRRFAALLGAHMREAPDDSGLDRADAARIRRAIEFAAHRLPWRCACLEQTVSAKLMLQRRGAPSTLYLGVRRTDGELVAHAWLRVGGETLIGAGEEPYTEVSRFA